MKRVLNALLMIILLTSCSKGSNEYIVDPGSYEKINEYVVHGKVETSTGEKVLPFNTLMTLTTYSDEAYEKLTPIYDQEIKRLHVLFDRYNCYLNEDGSIINNLKIINDSYGQNKEIKVDDDLFNLLEMSINLSKLTEGYFNPTMGYLIDGWNPYFSPFGSKDSPNLDFTYLNEQTIIERKESIIPYDKLEEVIVLDDEKNTVIFNKYKDVEKSIISLGAIAKGYAIDYMRSMFSKHKTPLIISGSNSSSYLHEKNPNPNRDNWMVQINSPYKDLLSVNLPLLLSELTPGKVLSTSGDYEQIFYYKNSDDIIRRHHILDPFKGYSNDYYRSVSLHSEKRSDILDGLSTALFNIENIDKAKKIITNVENYYEINIDYLFQKELEDKKLELIMNDNYKKTITKYYGEYVEEDKIVRVNL